MKRFTALLSLATICISSARAHEVWIEDTPTGALVIRFAEYGDTYEKSPGALDMLSLPTAWTPGAEGAVNSFAVEKKNDHFLLASASPKNAAQIETSFPVMGKPGNPEKPARKPFFYARWHVPGSSAAEPALIFDLVPSATTGGVTVFFRGKPLAGAKLKFHPPEGDEQELTSDDAGRVRFVATKPGFYLLAAAHQREVTPGFSGGKPYEVVSHNASLAWRQP
jgi:hypothetical protein